MLIRTTIILFILQCFAFGLLGHNRIVSFRHISSNDGLANNNVNCFAQDEWGYMWIGTANGLSRFDAYSFKNYNDKLNDRKGLVSTNIKAIHADSSNNIWIGTIGGGLSVLDRDSDIMYAYHLKAHNAQFNDINCILRLNEGAMLLGSNLGLYIAKGPIDKLHFTKLKYTTTEGSSLPQYKINTLNRDKHGRIWIGTEAGAFYILTADSNQPDRYTIKDFWPDMLASDDLLTGIQAVCITPDNELWFGSWGDGIQHFNIEATNIDQLRTNIINRKKFKKLEDITICTGLAYSQNTIFATTWNHGIVAINTNTNKIQHWKNTSIRHPGLVTNDLFSIYSDRDGNIWIGASRYGGVSIYTWKSMKIEQYDLSSLASNEHDRNRIYSLEGDTHGNIYVGGVGGLCRFQSKELIFQDIEFPLDKKEMASLKILSLEFDPMRNCIWAGSDGQGLYRYDIATKHFSSVKHSENNTIGLSNNSLHEILTDENSKVWIGSWGGGLDLYNPEENSFRNFSLDNDTTRVDIILDIAEDSSNMLWLATMGKGLIAFNKSTEQMHPQMIADKLGNIPLSYYYVHIDSSNNIWAACLDNGLVKYNPIDKSWKWFNEQSNMHFGHISGIEEENNMFFVNTDKGVYVLKDDKIVDNYKFTDDLAPLTFWTESSVSDKNKWVYLASDKGLLRYKPDMLQKDTIKPKVQITSISLFKEYVADDNYYDPSNSSIEEINDIFLSYTNNSFSLDFTAMDYTNSKNNHYSYKLKGFDEKWHEVPSNERKATYTNLPAGEYKFEIKSTNSDGIWSPKVRKMNIIIDTPFWHSQWFYLGVSALVVALFVAIAGIRQRNLRLKNKKLKKEIYKRTREIVQKSNLLESKNKELSKQSKLLNSSNEQIMRQKALLEMQHKELHQSISYAKNLQQSMLPSPREIRKLFPDHFIMFRPKEAVSGDFYWCYGNDFFSLFVAADCTGHGIPGAMVSMIGISLLKTIASIGQIQTASLVLKGLTELFNATLCESNSENNANDSMDIAVLVVDKKKKKVFYSGVYNPLYQVRNGKMKTYPADRFPISCEYRHAKFSNHEVDYEIGDTLYLFSDGFQDQFGGKKGKKFKSKQFKNILCEIAHENMAKQYKLINEHFSDWLFHGNSSKQNEQIDDVLVAGIRITESMFK